MKLTIAYLPEEQDEAADLLSSAKQLYLAWDGTCIPFNPHSTLEMDAFGDYRVHKINTAFEHNAFELELEMQPIKESMHKD